MIITSIYPILEDVNKQLEKPLDIVSLKELESVFRTHIADTEIGIIRVSIDFLKATNPFEFSTIGNRCLIILGLFPEQITKRNVPEDFYIEVGKSSYTLVPKLNFVVNFTKMVTLLRKLKPTLQ